MLICPTCKTPLVNNATNSLICDNNHCFDISNSGYINLLLSHQMNVKNPGDSKVMVKARTKFLEGGYYNILRDEICQMLLKYLPENGAFFDGGCGEGFYTLACAQTLRETKVDYEICAVDISKNAVEKTSKRLKNAGFENAQAIVASLFHIPVQSNFFSCYLSIFAPICLPEVKRILCADGIMIMAIPDEMHLYSLKEILYEQPYKNEVKPFAIEDFELLESRSVQGKITLTEQKQLDNLFTMTPYFYKTSLEDKAKLAHYFERESALEIPLAFKVLVYRKQ